MIWLPPAFTGAETVTVYQQKLNGKRRQEVAWCKITTHGPVREKQTNRYMLTQQMRTMRPPALWTPQLLPHTHPIPSGCLTWQAMSASGAGIGRTLIRRHIQAIPKVLQAELPALPAEVLTVAILTDCDAQRETKPGRHHTLIRISASAVFDHVPDDNVHHAPLLDTQKHWRIL